MKPNNVIRICLALLFCCSSLVQAETKKYQIPNPSILNQNAEALKFYDDVVKDKTVAINFIFTRCEMVCPLAGMKFAKLRKLIEAQAEQDHARGEQAVVTNDSLQLISITTDVPFDTPQRLKDWAQKFGAGDGWTQITGEKQNITALLKSLQAFVVDKEEHSSMVLFINDSTQQVKWISGDSDPKTLLAALQNW